MVTKEYTIRKNVLNLDLTSWNRANFLFPGETIKATCASFKQLIGEPRGFTAKFNEEEKEFFDEMYPRKL